MGQIISIVSGKGGIGKTMFTANIGRAMSNQGKNCLVIDLDFGLRNLDLALGMGDSVVFDFYDLVVGDVQADKVIIPVKGCNGLSFIGASQTKSFGDLDIDNLTDVMAKLAADYDYIFLDTKTGIIGDVVTSMMVSNQVVIIVDPTKASIRDGDRIKGVADSIEMAKVHLVINMIRPDLIKKGRMLDFPDIIKILPMDLLGLIPYDQEILLACDNGLALYGNERLNEPFVNIATRLQGYEVSYMNFTKDTGFLDSIKNLFKRK